MVNSPWINLVLGSQNRLRAAKRFSSVLSKTKRSFEENTIWLFLYLLKTNCIQKVASTRTLFYFSFRSFLKHRLTRKKNKNEELFSFSTTPNPLCWRSINSRGFYFLSRALDGLWRENRGSVNSLHKRGTNLNFCPLLRIDDFGWFFNGFALKCCHFPFSLC